MVSIESPGESECLSCDKFNDFTHPCLYNSATFSKDGSYYVFTCQGLYTESQVTVIKTETKETLYLWENNDDLHLKLESKAIPQYKDLFVDVEGGFQAQVRLTLPHDFDDTKKYPLLINT